MFDNFCECGDGSGMDTVTKFGIFAAILTTVGELITFYMTNKNNSVLQNRSGVMEELEYYRSESRELRSELVATRNRLGELEDFIGDLKFIEDPDGPDAEVEDLETGEEE